jgi:hypothetical protein
MSVAAARPQTAELSAAKLKKKSAAQTAQKETSTSPLKRVAKDARLDFIRRAQVWTPTNIPEMDLKAGPQGAGAFAPDEMVACDYVEAKLSGNTPKFNCAIDETDVVKVRYGKDNGEVQGSVLATRLLWALGFGADAVYPVRMTCRGCPADPWTMHRRVDGETLFDPAVIERKFPGREIESRDNPGWAWPELDLADVDHGGAPTKQRDALKLLAVFVQHSDNKPDQQRLLCLDKGKETSASCDKPFMMLHDVGLTFGHANLFNRGAAGSVNFEEWSKVPIWKDAAACIGGLSVSQTGTLSDPKIGEAGRQFLADLLLQLSDQQLHDLFEAAHVDRRSRKPGSDKPPASVDEWVAAFKHKRDEIVTNHCKS